LKRATRVAYGYRNNEAVLPQLKQDHFIVKGKRVDMDETFKITRFRAQDIRPVVAVDLGCGLKFAAPPKIDPADTHTVATGAMYRFARKFDYHYDRNDFKSFVREWLETNIEPLDILTDTTHATWIAGTPYTQARKDELVRKHEAFGRKLSDKIPQECRKLKCFAKDETYVPDMKHARCINSRVDEYKNMVGPHYQCISDKLFKLHWFIKKIPINERPQYIIDLIQRTGAYYICTDYTSFEAHFVSGLMEDCELQLAEHMTKKLPDGADFMRWARVKKDINKLNFKNFGVEIKAKRMSGEMDTSLSNGFSNLMFMLYFFKKQGLSNPAGVIEGDDGLFVVDRKINEKFFVDFGLNVKMELVSELNHASFCGMVFDLDEKTNVTNPIHELIGFGWSSAKYARSKDGIKKCLLRSKALSMAYQYPACPILTTLSAKICELTAGYDSLALLEKRGDFTCLYEKTIIREAHTFFEKHKLLAEPGPKTRILIEQLYGITLSDQIEIEKYIREMTSIHEIDIPALNKYLPKDCIRYADEYVVTTTNASFFNDLGIQMNYICPKTDFTAFQNNLRRGT
jgi:hypothetical protein